ncbi:MAG: O-methyltransferase [Dehalococcoidia bacterium]
MIRKVLPRSIRQRIVRIVSRHKLRRCPAVAIDATSLRARVPDLDCPELSLEWPAIERLIGAAGISPRSGGVNPGDRRAIYQLTRLVAPRNVLEIGTHVGSSTLMFALALKHDGGRITTVDIQDVNADEGAWKMTGCAQRPRDMLASMGCLDHVSFVTSASVDYLAGCRERYDLIFLDGLHEASMLYREIPLALRALAPGGLVLLHDVFPDLKPLWPNGAAIPGPWLALERFLGEGAGFRVHPLGELPWPTKLGTRMTSLALLLSAGQR